MDAIWRADSEHPSRPSEEKIHRHFFHHGVFFLSYDSQKQQYFAGSRSHHYEMDWEPDNRSDPYYDSDYEHKHADDIGAFDLDDPEGAQHSRTRPS